MLAIRWESPACQRGENNWEQGGEEKQTHDEQQNYGYEKWMAIKRLVKYWVRININILPPNIAMQLPPVSIFPHFAFASRLKRGSKAESRRHPIIWSFTACALTSLFVCRSLKSLDRLADAPFLSRGSKHRQHYQRPQLALLSIKSPLS